MKKIKLSIITVVRNNELQIEATIQSVLQQTFKDYEYIIIDGKSSDGTCKIIEKYKNSLDQFISENDYGIYDGMNKGTQLARGEWICFLNSGDNFHTENILQDIFGNSEMVLNNSDVIFSNVVLKNKNHNKLAKAKALSQFYKGMPFSHQANFIRSSLAKRYPFNLRFKYSADYDLYYNIYRKGFNFVYFEKPIAEVDIEKGYSKTLNPMKLLQLFNDYFTISYKYSNKLERSLLIGYSFLELGYAIFLNLIKKILHGENRK